MYLCAKLLEKGEQMNIKEIAKKVVTEQQGIAKASDFIERGLKLTDVVNLCNAGYLERVRYGYYQLADEFPVSEEQIIRKLIPNGIVCVESALFHYGYSDFTPRKWSIALPRTASRRIADTLELPLKPYYIQPELHNLGVTTDIFDGVELPVYDRERTICDCFKYRSKIDNELFNKAVNAYVIDDKKNLTNLSAYAKQLRVYKKVTELMEVLLNG